MNACRRYDPSAGQEIDEAAQGPQGARQEGPDAASNFSNLGRLARGHAIDARRSPVSTQGDASAEDEMYEVEEQLDKANAILKKEKEAAKKEKEVQASA